VQRADRKGRQVSVSERWARTDEQIALMYEARRRGGRCCWCGRSLDDGETVYFERLLIGERQRRPDGPVTHWSAGREPVGIECASPELLAQTEGQTPERCAQCGRGVVYPQARSTRHQVTCSHRCASRLAMLRQRAKTAVQVPPAREPAGSV